MDVRSLIQIDRRQRTRPWNIRTISGFAGGHADQSFAIVTLEINTHANTIEKVRAFVEAAGAA